MNLQNRFTAIEIRQLNRDTPVKTARAQQRLVKGFRTVRRSQDNNAFFAVKAIHL